MNSKQEKIIKILIRKGQKLLNRPYEKIDFFKDSKNIEEEKKLEANDLLNNLKEYPHTFVLACIMDSMINAEEAWLIPYKVSKQINGLKFSEFSELNQTKIKHIFKEEKIPRFWERKAKYFYNAIQKIKNEYSGDASKIWANNPDSCTVIKRFLEFDGVGRKIATMAANILARDFKIKMKNYHCIDVSPDIHVKRVFKRLDLMSKDSDDELMYITRGFYPKYPGIIDFHVWEIGRKLCRPRNPKCSECYLNNYCPKLI